MARDLTIVPDRVGPWARSDLETFLKLDVELEPKQPPGVYSDYQFGSELGFGLGSAGPGLLSNLNALSRLSPTWRMEEQSRLIGEAWSVRRRHPVYLWLLKNQHFKAANRAFELQQKKAIDGKLASPAAYFRFLKEFVQSAAWVFDTRNRPRGRSDHGATAERRAAAKKHADALIELLGAGISLDSYAENQQLRALLQSLRNELSATKRKTYGGARELDRAILRSLALTLVISCGLTSPTVIYRLASMTDIPCDMKTAQRYCNEAGLRYRRILATAMGDQGQKSGRS